MFTLQNTLFCYSFLNFFAIIFFITLFFYNFALLKLTTFFQKSKKIMEKSNEQLKNFLSSLSREDAKFARKSIAKACKTNTRTIYNWTNVGIKIKPLYQDQIEKVLKSKIFT